MQHVLQRASTEVTHRDLCVFFSYIEVLLHERDDASNHLHFDCLFESKFRLITQAAPTLASQEPVMRKAVPYHDVIVDKDLPYVACASMQGTKCIPLLKPVACNWKRKLKPFTVWGLSGNGTLICWVCIKTFLLTSHRWTMFVSIENIGEPFIFAPTELPVRHLAAAICISMFFLLCLITTYAFNGKYSEDFVVSMKLNDILDIVITMTSIQSSATIIFNPGINE